MKDNPKEEIATKNEAKLGEQDEDQLVNDLKSLTVECKEEKEKDDEVSSEDNNENDDKTNDEEEEDVIKSVKVKHKSECDPEDDDETNYSSKGPIQQRRVLLGPRVNANPYNQPKTNNVNHLEIITNEEKIRQKLAAVSVSDTSSLNLLQTTIPSGTVLSSSATGQFLDDPNVLGNILIVGSHGEQSYDSNDGVKKGIPSLPDLTSMTKNNAGGPRIVIREKANADGTWNATVLPTPLSPVVDSQLRKIGIWLPQQALPSQAHSVVNNGKLEILIQLDVKIARVIRHIASVGVGMDKVGQQTCYIMAQFVELKPFVSSNGELTGIDGLLEGIEETELDDALNLVNGKDLTDLLKTYGPNEDSMLMTLCCKKDESPIIRAQVFALVSRILTQQDPKMRANVVQKNACLLSALDYTTVTNNRRIACFLVDLYYVLGEDISCSDNAGNTILHMMARKGDVTAPTLQPLLGLRFAHENNRRVYSSDCHNNKMYLPIHFAAMSRRCPQIVIQMLQKDMPTCLTARTDNGSAPIHLACQYTSDPTMIATLLYYNREVVNLSRNDGFTPLHLIAARNDAMDRQIGLIPLDEETQVRMIRLLLDHGADRGIRVEQKYMPFDLVKVDRERARALLKLRRGESNNGRKTNNPGTNTSPTSTMAKGQNMANSPMGMMNSPGSCLSPTQYDTSPGPMTSQMSPSYSNVLGSYDPFIGGNNYIDNFGESPNPHMQSSPAPPSFGFSGGSNGFGGSDVFSDGGSNSDGGAESGGEGDIVNNLGDGDLISGTEVDSELDIIARALYNHPTIQAVMNGADNGGTQNTL